MSGEPAKPTSSAPPGLPKATSPPARRSRFTIRRRSARRIGRRCNGGSSAVFQLHQPYAAKRNWLFALTFTRGLQLPALAYLIAAHQRSITSRNLTEIYGYAAAYFALALFTTVISISASGSRSSWASGGPRHAHGAFARLMTMPMSFSTRQVWRIIKPAHLGYRQRARRRAGRGLCNTVQGCK